MKESKGLSLKTNSRSNARDHRKLYGYGEVIKRGDLNSTGDLGKAIRHLHLSLQHPQ